MTDFIRIAAAGPKVEVGNPQKNTERILQKIEQCRGQHPDLILFPELCLTGYTCADLFFQDSLLNAAIRQLNTLCLASEKIDSILCIGLPVRLQGQLYNSAAVLYHGKVLGLVLKTYIPTYNEFYEKRWFCPADHFRGESVLPSQLGLADPDDCPIPVGNDLIFDSGVFRFGLEICEDLWAPVPPSTRLALGGAEVLLNLSASNETISKRRYRTGLITQHSASLISTYAYVSAGCSESTTDLIFSGHTLICENGKLLCQNEKVIDDDTLLFADTDLGKLRADRQKIKTFADCAADQPSCRLVRFAKPAQPNDLSYYPVEKLPFVPNVQKDRRERCLDIFEMQVMGLAKRMSVTGSRPVIGISGGLDSTLALLVCTEAARRLHHTPDYVVGITMPCFGTTDRTYQNSLALMKTLGITSLEIPIREAVTGHFRDIGHDPAVTDLTFENSQARERTQVLMDYAGKVGGFVAGTGDLSELALGWCTYNADHMSMYGVNASVPKTLVRWMIDSIMEYDVFRGAGDILRDILDTPISPELLPPDEQGRIAQQTEELVGPYALHDFFLYYIVRFGFSPKKVFSLACKAFRGDFEPSVIQKWLVTFLRRFFSQQFKRSCLPDGVKIGSICLSPRGDWRMPSDACAAAWIAEAESVLSDAD